MNQPQLEERLRQLADELDVPASAAARQAIGRRARVLKRRRQVGRAVGGGVLALVLVAAVVGGLARRDGDRVDTVVGPGPADESQDARLRPLIVEGDEWQVVDVEDLTDVDLGDEVDPPYDPAQDAELHVFRGADSLVDPAVFLLSWPDEEWSSARLLGEEEVQVGEAEGFLSQRSSGAIGLRWQPAADTYESVQALGLTREEVLELGEVVWLQRLEDDMADDPGGSQVDAVPEVAVSALPEGIEQQAVDPGPPPADGPALRDVRRVMLARGQDQVTIQVDNRGERPYELHLSEWLASDGEIEQVSVMGRPALLGHHIGGDADSWELTWRQPAGAVATITFSSPTLVDRSTIDQVIEDLREMPEDDWQALLDEHG